MKNNQSDDSPHASPSSKAKDSILSYGTSGKKIGNAFLKWTFSEAAALFLRNNPQAQAWLEKMANKHNKARALTTARHGERSKGE